MSSSESQRPIPFRSKKALQPQALASDLHPLTAPTPEKPPQRPRRSRNADFALSLKEVRKAAAATEVSRRESAPARRKIVDCPEEVVVKPKKELPERYQILCEFFNGLDNAVRLLRLKGSAPSFANICPKIECLTDRRFTYRHLAQLKFILPQVIEIKRTLVFDERTSCMKPDLHITINLDALDDDGKFISEGGSIYLRRVFRSRLVEFSKAHPEGSEVPEEELPEPFNVRKQVINLNRNEDLSVSSPEAVPANSCNQLSDEPALLSGILPGEQNQQPAVASHLPVSFRRRFSQKLRSNDAEKPKIVPELSSLPSAISIEEIKSDRLISSLKGTPRKEPCTSVQNTPAKLVSTPARLMSATPGLCPPKRSYMSPENDSASSPNKLVRRPPRTRSLKFDSPMKNEEDLDVQRSSVNNDLLDILPENLLQSIREKERIAMEERKPAISQAKRRRQMIACLPKIFNMIHFLFQSISRSVITKDELIHKLISSHSDIVDRREVEEQLSLLLELVPDWISEKLTSGGDLLLRINKVSSPQSIRTRLEEAN